MAVLKRYKRIVIISCALIIGILVLFLYALKTPLPAQPVAQDGHLDLTEWNFEKDGIISLDGEWEFYWSRLLTSDDFRGGTDIIQPDGYVTVPDVWNNYVVAGKNLPGDGFATYHLRIKSNDTGQDMGLKIANMSTAYKLMMDGETIAVNGMVSDTPEGAQAEYRPQAVTFKNAWGDYEIIIQISNYTYARGGLWYSVYLGTDQHIQSMKEMRQEEKCLFSAASS